MWYVASTHLIQFCCVIALLIAQDFFFDIYEKQYCGIDARDKVLKFVELFTRDPNGGGEAELMKPLADYFTKNSPGGEWPIPVYSYRLDLNKVCKKDSLTTYNKIAAPFVTFTPIAPLE